MALAWYATAHIYFNNVLAFNPGDLVPDANVAAYGYDTAGLVTHLTVPTPAPLTWSGAFVPYLGDADGGVTIGDPNGVSTQTGSNVILGARTARTIDKTTSVQNVAVGHRALELASNNGATSSNNVALGFQAMGTSAGSYNVAIGYSCLGGAESTNAPVGYVGGFPVVQTENVAIGRECLIIGTTAARNVAIGSHAAGSVTSGNDNVAIGSTAMAGMSTGNRNVVIGYHAGELATAGDDNILIGQTAGQNQTTANANIAIGSGALQANLTGLYNTAVGIAAVNAATSTHNTAIGYQAGVAVTTGGGNTALGAFALGGVTTGGANVSIGRESGTSLGTLVNAVIIGFQAAVQANEGVALGKGASVASGHAGSVALGWNSVTTAGNQVEVGARHVELLNVSQPATPSGGGRLFAVGGALKWIGSSGTVTTIAVA